MPDLVNATDSELLEFVSLIAGQQSFCIQITKIREIRRWAPVTMLPHSPSHVLGVINLRGAVIPIIDLAEKLGFPASEPTERHVIIITTIDERTIGLLVDSVSEILSVKREEVRETPRVRDDETNRAIRGVIPIEDDMTRVIELEALMPQIKDMVA